jgi:hypothetical protein
MFLCWNPTLRLPSYLGLTQLRRTGILAGLFDGIFRACRRNTKMPRGLSLQDACILTIPIRNHQMILEVTFWIAVIAASRKLGKVYARSGDVLYGSYVSR